MPRASQRQAPSGNYSNAPKNLRNFHEGKNIVPQGIITDPQQNVHNVEHIIKYLQSNAFDRKIQSMIDAAIGKAFGNLPEGENTTTTIENRFDPSSTNQAIQNIWNAISNLEQAVAAITPEPEEPEETNEQPSDK
jgi:hypothetical protein